MATQFKKAAQKFTHLNQSLSTTAATVANVPAKTTLLWFHNADASIVESIFLDGGANFFTLAAGATFTLEGDALNTLTIKVKSASGTPSMEILAAFQA